MRIIFIGTVETSAILLKKLITLKANIIHVITKKSSNFNSDFFDLSSIAKAESIPFKYVENINDEENVALIKKLVPDIIFCFGWSHLIKREILNIPNKGIIGFHPSYLPLNRGRHPLIWALVLGLKETASTFFLMNEGADTGKIISQEKVTITFEDDASTLYKKICKTAEAQIESFLPKLSINEIISIKKENKLSNYWRKRVPKDGEIDWRMSSLSIYNLIRGLTKPYPGAHFLFKNKEVKVWKSRIVKYSFDNIEPGKILNIDNDGITIKTGDNAIKIIDVNIKINIGDYL